MDTSSLSNGERNILVSALGALLREAREAPVFYPDFNEITALRDSIQYGEATASRTADPAPAGRIEETPVMDLAGAARTYEWVISQWDRPRSVKRLIGTAILAATEQEKAFQLLVLVSRALVENELQQMGVVSMPAAAWVNAAVENVMGSLAENLATLQPVPDSDPVRLRFGRPAVSPSQCESTHSSDGSTTYRCGFPAGHGRIQSPQSELFFNHGNPMEHVYWD